jgi:hypothetical protein
MPGFSSFFGISHYKGKIFIWSGAADLEESWIFTCSMSLLFEDFRRSISLLYYRILF